MKRYDSKEWKELVAIQNEYYPNTDILTITGFMDDTTFFAHVEDYKDRVKNKKA